MRLQGLRTPFIFSSLSLSITLLLVFVALQRGGAQCMTASANVIPDDGVLTIDFLVSGLVDNDLASPTQGICGVEIDFMHEYLGDLTITLISPAGTMVQLVGPVTTAITPTNLSRWNIDFIPCLMPAAPDPGFADVWSNLQAWQVFTPYTGSYHPYSGCLEDFNTGSANGTWTIILEDHDPLQTGSVESIKLIFCNPNGLLCNECDAYGGLVSPSSITLCEGETFATSAVNVDFGGNQPDPALYNFIYLFISGNAITQSGSSFSAVPAPGSYNLCGLSFLIEDSAQVNSLISSGNYDQILQQIANGTLCASASNSCVNVTVTPKPDTMIISQFLCAGETFLFDGQVYNTTGVFYRTHDGPGMCDTVIQLNITVSQLTMVINTPEILSCANGVVSITSTVSGNSGSLTYSWSTNNGNITSGTNNPSITVNQPGRYFLTVTDSECTIMKSVVVVADPNFPKVLLTGGTITCNNPAVTMIPVYFPTNAAVLWNGPSGFTSDEDTITVSVPGIYSFTATDAAGCFITKSVEVKIDTATHPISINVFEKNCIDQFVKLGNTNELNIIAWAWTGPNNYVTNYWRPDISDPGLYTLTVTFTNGCQRSASYFFDGDFTIPDVIISPQDTLHCNEVLSLTLFSNTPGASYYWSGPQGFTSSQPVINTDQFGIYSGTVTAPNGCTASLQTQVIKGNDIFDFEAFSDTVTCRDDTVMIGVIATEADLFHWLNFPGPDSNNSSIPVTAGGMYSVIMTDTNSGCMVTANLQVHSDFTYPSFGYTTDTITCTNPIAELNIVPFLEYPLSEIFWRLPDQTIVPGPTLFSNVEGEIQLIGISPIGCVGTWRIHIPFDTLPPAFFLDSDTLDCAGVQTIQTLSVDPLTSISWAGPNGFGSNLFQPMIVDTGFYSATTTGENGCEAVETIHVPGDFEKPALSITNEELTCLKPDAILTVSATDQVIRYEWRDDNSMVIGTDSTVSVTQDGSYYVLVEGENHCISMDTVAVAPRIYPVTDIIADTLDCAELSAALQGSSDAVNPVHQWLDLSGNIISTDDEVTVNDTGPYVFSATGENGCTTLDTVVVPADTLRPVAIIELIGEVRCQSRDFMLDATLSTPPGVQFNWQTIGGMIVGPVDQPMADASDTGVYYLTVTDPENGCMDSDSILMEEHPDAITMAYINIKLPECSGDTNAELLVTTLEGGVQPFSYQLNGQAFQADKHFKGLSAGSYLLQVMDAAGCLYDTLVEIIPTNPYTVDAGPDQEIYIGDIAILSGITDILPGELLYQDWDSMGVVFCPDCPQADVAPLSTSTYRFTVTSKTGCVVEDFVTVFVLEKGKFFVANIFTPNGDDANEVVYFHGTRGIAKVLKWTIFDRWGNAVFGRTDFEPNDPAVFWDGTAQGSERLNPGVFPYIVELELVNGDREIQHGTITLIR